MQNRLTLAGDAATARCIWVAPISVVDLEDPVIVRTVRVAVTDYGCFESAFVLRQADPCSIHL